MTTHTHDCPGGCGKQVSSNQLACPADWYRLPLQVRQAIWREYRREARGTAHRTALAEAATWYRTHPRRSAGD